MQAFHTHALFARAFPICFFVHCTHITYWGSIHSRGPPASNLEKGWGGIPVSDEEAIDFSGVQYVFDVNGFEKFIEVVDAENTISGCVGHSAYRLRVRKLWQCVTLS